MQNFIDPDLLDRLRVGPLASCLDSYLKRIESEGFLPSSVPMQMYAIARFSNWLLTMQLDLHQVDEATVGRFLHRDRNIVRCPRQREPTGGKEQATGSVPVPFTRAVRVPAYEQREWQRRQIRNG